MDILSLIPKILPMIFAFIIFSGGTAFILNILFGKIINNNKVAISLAYIVMIIAGVYGSYGVARLPSTSSGSDPCMDGRATHGRCR